MLIKVFKISSISGSVSKSLKKNGWYLFKKRASIISNNISIYVDNYLSLSFIIILFGMSEDFYKILELTETASIDEIKKSYRRLSLLHHPDRNNNSPDSVAKFQKISDAYETIGDVDKKREYDMTRNNPFAKMMGQGQSHGQPNFGQMDDLFASLFGMQQGFNPFGQMHFSQGFPQSQGPFSQGLGQGQNIRVFHNGVPININQNQKPTPITSTIVIPIDKILTGTTVPLDIERWLMENGNKVFEHETVYIPVPKGMDEGEVIVLKDKGNVINDTCKGDVKVVIKIENHTEFQRSGLDLLLPKTITMKEALCGFTFELKYITGKTYTINNNTGNIIPNGYKKIIPNMGFSRDDHTGNLVIVFEVKFPDKLSEEVIDALKKIDF
jgi:DnaJ-class molecular chaperone